eukprot:Tamp_13698.p5 GENE.Tamp_13698~~Tamp_13698.p5  ORF type:complete len:120 (-),score=12.15 Tamp_13698:1214-1573(-)
MCMLAAAFYLTHALLALGRTPGPDEAILLPEDARGSNNRSTTKESVGQPCTVCGGAVLAVAARVVVLARCIGNGSRARCAFCATGALRRRRARTGASGETWKAMPRLARRTRRGASSTR